MVPKKLTLKDLCWCILYSVCQWIMRRSHGVEVNMNNSLLSHNPGFLILFELCFLWSLFPNHHITSRFLNFSAVIATALFLRELRVVSMVNLSCLKSEKVVQLFCSNFVSLVLFAASIYFQLCYNPHQVHFLWSYILCISPCLKLSIPRSGIWSVFSYCSNSLELVVVCIVSLWSSRDLEVLLRRMISEVALYSPFNRDEIGGIL